MSKFIIVVMDGVGIGALPDALLYGDEGTDTLGHLAAVSGGLSLPCLESLGLGNLGDFKGMRKNPGPLASFGRMEELSKGKDTITGHWEMMGVVNETPFPTYPEGFPKEVIAEFERRIGRKVLWNRPASGTEIIERLGREHMRTGRPIVYTSADSVFQVAAHEDIISVEELYSMCRVAREILKPPHNVCRVIARPFVGPPFTRTYRRKDFPLPPPEETVLDLLKAKGAQVVSVGKVGDMFGGRGFTASVKAAGNQDIMRKVAEAALSLESGLIFSNLVDFDTLYGHRNDAAGFKKALEEFDSWLSYFIPLLGADDHLLLTADHGNDPTTPGTDHTREYVPVLFYGRRLKPRDLGTRRGFMDIGATVADIFGVEFGKGKSFLK
ncbi:MAG: phosphopentomutase [Thermodesulfovibrionales bacterium]